LAHRYGFSGVEILDRNLERREPAYLDQLRRALEESHCRVALAMSNDFALADANARAHQVRHAIAMVEVASRLGAKVARVNLGGQRRSVANTLSALGKAPLPASAPGEVWTRLQRVAYAVATHPAAERLTKRFRRARKGQKVSEPESLDRVVGCLREVLAVAEKKDLRLGIENHWGLSTYPETILKTIDRVGSPRLGTCPDLGNFPEDVDRYEGLRKLAPRAVHVHAKSYDFDAAGEETAIDYRRCLAIFKEAGYDGAFSVEYEGGGDPVQGSLRTRQLILRYW